MPFDFDLDFLVTDAPSLLESDYEWCMANNLGRGGRIRRELREATERLDERTTIILARVMDTNVGWAIIFDDASWEYGEHDGCYRDVTRRAVGFFVPEENRRLGIGTRLTEKAIEVCGNIKPTFYPDNMERAKFFARFDGRFIYPPHCENTYAPSRAVAVLTKAS